MSYLNLSLQIPFLQVETVGDCYVAVTGLPDPQKDHAVIMAAFAQSCLSEFSTLTRKLETTLGYVANVVLAWNK